MNLPQEFFFPGLNAYVRVTQEPVGPFYRVLHRFSEEELSFGKIADLGENVESAIEALAQKYHALYS